MEPVGRSGAQPGEAVDVVHAGGACARGAEHFPRQLCLRELEPHAGAAEIPYLRLQRAKELLESSDDKLEAIAPAVGYVSALVFSRAFKRWVGCTPIGVSRGASREALAACY